MTYYNKRAHPRLFHLGDMVLRWVFENTTEIGDDKLQHNWEELYVVLKVKGVREYHLQTLDETPLPRP